MKETTSGNVLAFLFGLLAGCSLFLTFFSLNNSALAIAYSFSLIFSVIVFVNIYEVNILRRIVKKLFEEKINDKSKV